MRLKSTFISALLLIGIANFAAKADIQFTRITTSHLEEKPSASGITTHQSQMTYFITGEKKRVEYGENNLFNSNKIVITRCDLNQRFTLDDTLKIYTISDLDAKGIIHTPTKEELKEDIPGGKMVTDYSIQKTGSEKIDDFDTRVYRVKIHTQYDDNRESSYDGKMWVADIPIDSTCDSPKPLQASSVQIENLPTGKRKMTYEYTGDIEILNEISSKLIVRQEGTSENTTIREQIRGYSAADLDEKLFEIPADYRKVSPEEFKKRRAQKEQNH